LADQAPVNATLNSETGLFEWTPPADWPTGTTSVRIMVQQTTTGETDAQTFDIRVEPAAEEAKAQLVVAETRQIQATQVAQSTESQAEAEPTVATVRRVVFQFGAEEKLDVDFHNRTQWQQRNEAARTDVIEVLSANRVRIFSPNDTTHTYPSIETKVPPSAVPARMEWKVRYRRPVDCDLARFFLQGSTDHGNTNAWAAFVLFRRSRQLYFDGFNLPPKQFDLSPEEFDLAMQLDVDRSTDGELIYQFLVNGGLEESVACDFVPRSLGVHAYEADIEVELKSLSYRPVKLHVTEAEDPLLSSDAK
jgi:hypothetical protein